MESLPMIWKTIFVPFSRLRVAQSVSGTGLGLSLSKVLTEAMHGKLSVESEIGRGSVFRVEFALLTDHLTWTAPPIELDHASISLFKEEAPPETSILYIEDNVTNLELVQYLLAEHHSVRVLSARDGAAGLRLAIETKPDLCLLDVHLPDISGAEVLRLLRLESSLVNLPVIVISADTSPSLMAEMTALGISEYITKPFDLSKLRQSILDKLPPLSDGIVLQLGASSNSHQVRWKMPITPTRIR